MGEKHTALLLNIGTYPEEDAAYELLNNLRVTLPLVVVVTWVLDALLAAASSGSTHGGLSCKRWYVFSEVVIQTENLFHRNPTDGSLKRTLKVQ